MEEMEDARRLAELVIELAALLRVDPVKVLEMLEMLTDRKD